MPTELDPRLERWLDALLDTPGLTAIREREQARREHVLDSLQAVPFVEHFEGPIADVGSGGGAPGIPLAAVFPERTVTLIESQARKVRFLERWSGACRSFDPVAPRFSSSVRSGRIWPGWRNGSAAECPSRIQSKALESAD